MGFSQLPLHQLAADRRAERSRSRSSDSDSVLSTQILKIRKAVYRVHIFIEKENLHHGMWPDLQYSKYCEIVLLNEQSAH